MWSVYDTLILITGVLTAAIALIPMVGIEKKTRVTAAAIGGGLIVLSLVLGSLSSFSYPSIVVVAPVIPLIAAGAIVKAARDTERFHATMRDSSESAPAGLPAATAQDARADAWAALFDESTDASMLADIAGRYPEFAPQIASHPNCYDELRAWAAAQESGAEGASHP